MDLNFYNSDNSDNSDNSETESNTDSNISEEYEDREYCDDSDNSDNSDNSDIPDEKENILLTFFLETILQKLRTDNITSKEKTELYRFILNYNNVKNIETNEYLQNKNMLKYYILGWYVSSNLSSNI